MKFPHRQWPALAAAFLFALLAGCNTMEGFGEDINSAGDAISGWASGDEKPEQQTARADQD